MIPDIKEILKRLKEGAYTLEGAEMLINKHIKLAVEKANKQDERKRLFQEVGVMLFPCWVKSANTDDYHTYLKKVGKQITDSILQASEDFAKEGE